MGRGGFDPTSLAAKQLQAQQKQAHRIRLKKQLSKAQAKLDAAANFMSPTLQPAIEEAVAQVNQPTERSVTATAGPMRRFNKPDPCREALNKSEERLKAIQSAAEERTREILQQERIRLARQKKRERLHRKLTSTTRLGQPRLASHIDVLLSKIQKGSQ